MKKTAEMQYYSIESKYLTILVICRDPIVGYYM